MLTLITIPFSHYCEKARWALEYGAVRFDEKQYAPIVHSAASLRHGGSRTVPVLITPERTLTDSTAILELVDAGSPGLLYPRDEAGGHEVRALEDLFDEKYGPAVRRWIYFHLLERRDLTLPLFEHGANAAGRALVRLAYPLLRTVIRRGLRIDARTAEVSRQRVYAVLDKVDALLADGRPYLAGDRFTAADLTFAALSGPLLLVPEYAVPLPTLASLPEAMQAEVQALRSRPAGHFALALYARLRR